MDDTSTSYHLLAFELTKLSHERDNALLRAMSGTSSDSSLVFHGTEPTDGADWFREDAADASEMQKSADSIRSHAKDVFTLRLKHDPKNRRPPFGGGDGGVRRPPGQGQSRKAQQRRAAAKAASTTIKGAAAAATGVAAMSCLFGTYTSIKESHECDMLEHICRAHNVVTYYTTPWIQGV